MAFGMIWQHGNYSYGCLLIFLGICKNDPKSSSVSNSLQTVNPRLPLSWTAQAVWAVSQSRKRQIYVRFCQGFIK